MRKRRTLLIVAALIAFTLPVAITVFQLAERHFKVKAAGTGGPYIITQQESLLCEKEGPVVAAHRTIARASDGSRAEMMMQTSGEMFKTVYRADGWYMEANEQANAKSTYRKPWDDAALGFLDPEADCLKTFEGLPVLNTEKRGKQRLYGYETVKLVSEELGVRITTWNAPALGCSMLKQIYEQKRQSGKWMATSIVETTAISETEPEPHLFTSHAQEVPPRAHYRAVARWKMRGKPAEEVEKEVERWTARAKRVLDIREATYAAGRK